ncbi:3-deoxy-D-manno-octulosonic acid transferase [Pedobacter deserti]|uniref:3-deoxy-D-manno-octulosonic acid transferase n=1 Tax=Pedobacter deserti TaxID=2817382 RepID=UPI00210DA7A7|nr:glycosyltransferase N-terminal domain-containing protein [Pedobacter sp. SYSU D00382]
MLWLYNISIQLYSLALRLFSLFHPKARLLARGRKRTFPEIERRLDGSTKHIWFHFASLGEFEQGRPVLEMLREQHPEKPVVITFFSPSGYEVRKNYPNAEGVFYLPADTAANARKFVRLVNPEIAVFTKYEFWYHYFSALHARQIPLILISCIFRPNQIYFKWYGGFNRKILRFVSHFFIQNVESAFLLRRIKVSNLTLSGDTRFDRVAQLADTAAQIPLAARFSMGQPVLVAGSTWEADENLLFELVQAYPIWKFIIAPHEVGAANIGRLLKQFPASKTFTQLQAEESVAEKLDTQVLIIDSIGMLSSLYRYGNIAYIGGGFGAGIHNTLEAAAFGLPIIFGPKYQKFQEAKDLIKAGAAISIHDANDLKLAFEHFIQTPEVGDTAKTYVEDNTGSTRQITGHLKTLLKP